MYGSASEIYNHTVSSLYQDIDFVEHSEEEDSLYAVWSHLYQVIGRRISRLISSITSRICSL